MKKWIALGIIACLIAASLIYFNLPSHTTVGAEMERLQEEHGDIQSLLITNHSPPQGIAETERYVILDDPTEIEQLLSEAASTELTPIDTPPPAYYYSIEIVSSENRFTLLLFDDGLSLDGSNHFLIEGENLFIQAIEDGDYEWVEDER